MKSFRRVEAVEVQPGGLTLDLPKFAREVSVMAWVEDECGNVLMVRQAQGKRLWTLPGGKVRAVEKLGEALRRELLEETGERVRAAHLAALFDRPDKRSLTILYRVSLLGSRLRVPKGPEISTAEFKARLPSNRSPSVAYFWKLRESVGF